MLSDANEVFPRLGLQITTYVVKSALFCLFVGCTADQVAGSAGGDGGQLQGQL